MLYLKLLLVSLFGFSPMANAGLEFVPSKPRNRILVVLHGCLQSPEYMALGAGLHEFASREGISVLYPEVLSKTNPLGCWNWYLPENQKRDSGELKFVIDEIRNFQKRSGLDQAKTELTVLGMSSGAAIANALLACYPELFTAGAIHSGPAYGIARDLKSGDKLLKEGPGSRARSQESCDPKKFKGRLLVIHGKNDPVVHLSHGQRIMDDFFGAGLDGGGRGRLLIFENTGHEWTGVKDGLKFGALFGPSSPTPVKLPFFRYDGESSTGSILSFLF
ncbi:MAG: prolyl oligopeptidase family serine peptidase [Deltaproteobacteria bacterium]|jgi:poly(hydroxyalkanoate) depolymerase family esterase|nr:prolyl oligopeptidase family serine peptidase [Deltaproteobacteria bacterium]